MLSIFLLTVHKDTYIWNTVFHFDTDYSIILQTKIEQRYFAAKGMAKQYYRQRQNCLDYLNISWVKIRVNKDERVFPLIYVCYFGIVFLHYLPTDVTGWKKNPCSKLSLLFFGLNFVDLSSIIVCHISYLIALRFDTLISLPRRR